MILSVFKSENIFYTILPTLQSGKELFQISWDII
jgi:hypothetical protein